MSMPDLDFWKRKLMAYLHDPPCKCFDIAEHEKRAEGFRSEAGIKPDDYKEFAKECDRTASAADRFPFPGKTSGCGSNFSGGEDTPFKHPLGGSKISFKVPMPTADLAEEIFQTSIGSIPYDLPWKEKFFLYWRRWQEESSKADERLAYLPADTRMPDHTIWSHMSLTSALQACVNSNKQVEAAFLLFNFGPVQEFIAQARSARDLVSGSYMLSFLVASAIKAISDEIGPDNIIYPSLKGQPIFDILNREVFEQIKLNEDNLWKRINYNAHQLAMPSLPNRFLALVPSSRGKELSEKAESALKDTLKAISEECFDAFKKLADKSSKVKTEELNDWKKRWDKQVKLFPQITWTITPWDKDVSLDDNLAKLKNLAEGVIPPNHRDGRFYDTNKKLNNIGFTWQAQYAGCSAELNARRNTRDFEQFLTDEKQAGTPKDSLSGKDEIIGSEDFWKWLKKEDNKTPFKENDGVYGAINIIKRLWVRNDYVAYLKNLAGKKPDFGFESVEDIAKNNDDNSPYVAVIAMDGDEMGKWVSGEKTPEFLEQLSDKARKYFEGLSGYDKSIRRALSPSYHLQFSEALSNFANHIAWRLVKAFGGQLIYAGGDDVLAMLPADKAIACSLTLRSFFRGEYPQILKDSQRIAGYFNHDLLKSIDIKDRGWIRIEGKESYPLLMPGPNADVSCGIAIAHKHHPLQHIVKEAQKAEKKAKNVYGRSAFAISLMKRGGETIEYGSKWDSNAISLYEKYCSFRNNFKDSKKPSSDAVSGRFPYALSELLKPYRLGEAKFVDGFNPKKVILKELEQVFERQGGANLKNICTEYLNSLDDKDIDNFAKLFLVASFIERDREEN